MILSLAALLLAVFPLSAQSESGQTDSLVYLITAHYLEQVEIDGSMARKAIEPTFLHNGTYLSCDTAYWHVDEKIINCFGNVRLTQGESVLTSEKLDYLIDEDLAQFRGAVVQLQNKQDNLLRTRILDYNTRDSVAVFRGGAAMHSDDGQLIESDEGSYSSATELFTFRGNVNMFADSVFVRTELLDYDSEASRADFLTDIDFWKDENMLSAGTGWYDRGAEIFFFRDRVHGLGETQESWSDSLYYYRNANDILMLGSVQVQDQSRKVAAMGDRLHYLDSLSRVTLEHRASAALWDDEGQQADTTYLGATRFVYETQQRCDIPEEELEQAQARLDEMMVDPVSEYRQRAAAEAAAAAAALADNRGDVLPPPRAVEEVDDTTSFAGLAGESFDEVLADSTAVAPLDTTKIGFLLATGDVRIYREDMQVRCDSLRYSDLDSIARLYKNPVVWNEIRRQYNADSLFVLIRDQRMDRANLLSNAFIHTEETSDYYDQIRSSDIIAYFDEDTNLRRFDALGGVNALFYLEENDAIATVNRVECRMMMATLKDGELQQAYYFENPKSDAFPVVQLPRAEHRLRGFNWQPERRPQGKFDVTAMVVRPSERESYEARPHAEFPQTEIYFPGRMEEIYKTLEDAKAKREAGRSEEAEPQPEMTEEPADTTAFADLIVESPAAVDSLAVGKTVDEVVSDETAPEAADQPAPVSSDTTDYMSSRELARAMRIARRDARWAALDARDAEKAAAKQAAKDARAARRAARTADREARQDALDAAKLQKYIESYQKQKERHERRKQKPEPAGERPSGIETGGELPAPVGSE